MSRRRGHQHYARRPPRPEPAEPTTFRAQLAWLPDLVVVEEVQRETHDRLIAELGDRRRSGVQWTIYDRTDAALAVVLGLIDALDVDTVPPEVLDQFARMVYRLRASGGGLVVAYCEAAL